MKLKLLTLAAFIISLTSCFDIQETITVKEDGSGVYEQKIDMARIMGMMGDMIKSKMQAEGNQFANAKMDTTVYFKAFLDSIPDADKRLLQNSYVKLHINMEENEIAMSMYHPFANNADFNELQQLLAKKGSGKMMSKIMAKMGLDDDKEKKGGKEGDEAGLPTSDFIYTLTNNTLKKEVKESALAKAAEGDDDGAMPEQLKEMMKMNFTLTVHLPRPVKNASGIAGQVSADKKDITFNNTLSFKSHPKKEDFNFSLEY